MALATALSAACGVGSSDRVTAQFDVYSLEPLALEGRKAELATTEYPVKTGKVLAFLCESLAPQ